MRGEEGISPNEEALESNLCERKKKHNYFLYIRTHIEFTHTTTYLYNLALLRAVLRYCRDFS